jgi:hypothetical protein
MLRFVESTQRVFQITRAARTARDHHVLRTLELSRTLYLACRIADQFRRLLTRTRGSSGPFVRVTFDRTRSRYAASRLLLARSHG